MPGRKALLGMETFISVVIYTPSSLKAASTGRHKGGETASLPPKEEQNKTPIVIKPLTGITVANGLPWGVGGHVFLHCTSDWFETFIAMKILDKGKHRIEVQE